MAEPAAPPNDIWVSYVPGRRSPYKYYTKPGPARGSIMLTLGGVVPRGGTVWHYVDGEWILDRHFEPNRTCTVCEQEIEYIWIAIPDSPKGTKREDMRYKHSNTHIRRGVVCEPPPQQRLDFGDA